MRGVVKGRYVLFGRYWLGFVSGAFGGDEYQVVHCDLSYASSLLSHITSEKVVELIQHVLVFRLAKHMLDSCVNHGAVATLEFICLHAAV